MEEIDVALKRASENLQAQIDNTQDVFNSSVSLINSVIAQIDKIVTSIAVAHSQEKDPTAVAVDEMLKLRNSLVSKLFADQNAVTTAAGQKSGLDAALQYMTEFAKDQKDRSDRLERESQHVQRTKERIESGDLRLTGQES